MKEIEISIIVPVYNVELYLRECLDSVINQDFESYELLCINDGSTDKSPAILQEYQLLYPGKIKVINQQNQGLSATRNRGVDIALGQYLLFLDSDDVLINDSLRKLSEIIRSSNPDIIAFNSELYNQQTGEIESNSAFNHTGSKVFDSGLTYFDEFVSLRGWGPSAVCFYAFKRELIVDNRMKFEPGLLHEDELFMPEVLYFAGKTCTITDVLYQYRIRSGSIVHSKSEKNNLDSLDIANRLSVFFADKNVSFWYIRRTIYNLILGGIQGLMNTKEQRRKIPLESRKALVDMAFSSKYKLIAYMIWLDVRIYKLYFKLFKK